MHIGRCSLCQAFLFFARWDVTCQVNVAPFRRNSNLLPYPGLRRPPGASPGAMHGTALRAELGQSDDVIWPLRAEKRRDGGGPRMHAAGTAALPGMMPPGRRRSQESNASFPRVPKVPTVQSMGPCLMSRESSPQRSATGGPHAPRSPMRHSPWSRKSPRSNPWDHAL